MKTTEKMFKEAGVMFLCHEEEYWKPHNTMTSIFDTLNWPRISKPSVT
jgi:hypothetical protein